MWQEPRVIQSLCVSSSFPRKRGFEQRKLVIQFDLACFLKLSLACGERVTFGMTAGILPSAARGQRRCSRRSCGAVPKSNQKARRPTRCSDSHRANQNALCFSAPAGRRELAHPCAQTSAPCSRWRLRCSAPQKAPFIPRIRPSLDYVALLLRHDAAERGPCGAARGRRISPQGGAHEARQFANGHGCPSSKPRRPCADP